MRTFLAQASSFWRISPPCCAAAARIRSLSMGGMDLSITSPGSAAGATSRWEGREGTTASCHPLHKPSPGKRQTAQRAAGNENRELQFMASHSSNENSPHICSYRAALHWMLAQPEIRAGRQPLPNKGRVLSFPLHYTAVWTLGQSFMPCHIKLAATNIMELNELPVDAGEMLLDPACWQGKMPWTGETCVISVDYKASCNLKAVKRHKKSCFDIFFHCLLLLAATIWNIPHFLPSVQVPNMSRELGTKFKGRSRGCLGSHLISNFTLCSKVEGKISRQTSPAVLQHL